MPCINLPKYYKCVFIRNPPREGGGGGGLWILLWEYGFRDWILDFMPLYIYSGFNAYVFRIPIY